MTRDEELERWARRLVQSANGATASPKDRVSVDRELLQRLGAALDPHDLKMPEHIRQSLIAAFDSCPLRARFSLEDTRRTPGELAARGTLFHRWVHLAVRHLWEHGERRMPVDVGLEMLLEVMCQIDVASEEVVPLTMAQMRWVRVCVVKWCESTTLDASKVYDVEKRYFADLQLPTGRTVPITGQMDLVVVDPPRGLVVIDYKAGYRRPKQPRDEEKTAHTGDGLTELGWVQWLVYSFLAFQNFPSIDYVIFRERHVLWGEERYARMERWQSEAMEDVLKQQVALLVQAIEEGPTSARWTPSAGAHCALCPNPRGCPILDDEQIDLTTSLGRRRVAQEWVVAGQVRNRRREILDGLVEQYGPIEIPHADGRRVVGWEIDPGWEHHPVGHRNFGIYEPPEIPESPFDVVLEKTAREHRLLTE